MPALRREDLGFGMISEAREQPPVVFRGEQLQLCHTPLLNAQLRSLRIEGFLSFNSTENPGG